MDTNSSGRKKRVTNNSKGVHKRGEGLNTGPVGKKDGYGSSTGSASSSSISRAAKGGGGASIILLIIVLLLGKGNILSSLFSSNAGSMFTAASQTSTAWVDGKGNVGKLDTSVSKDARAKRVSIKGGGKDTVTIMVYMCGTDLESKYGMATNDINEMCNAKLSDKVNIIIYTGGCKTWKTKGISNSVNQIYKIKDGKLVRLVEDDGNKAMTDPNTLSSFIKYCKTNYPADRNDLIFWDHGGGSISGYGFDEKNTSKGSMDLSKIDKALKDGGVTFDFIGFDACLMATLETALMTSDYADYLIASEETEPGIGWYYTDWLNALGKNTSMPTIEIGKNIVDDFVDECNKKCKGQKTTLAIIDLAELSQTVPDKLSAFSSEASSLIKKEEYKKISDARAGSREFAPSSRIDQVDLVNLTKNINTDKSNALANALLSSVKYNRTSSNMTNAYGISIYFQYKNTKKVSSAVSTYSSIGMDDEYSKCIKAFAGLEIGGQAAAGGAISPLSVLADFVPTSQTSGTDAISSLLEGFISGNKSINGMGSDEISVLEDDVDTEEISGFVSKNQFDASKLVWKEKDGKHLMSLSKSQWDLVQSLQLNVFVDDGEGYIDLGLDNVYEFTKDGELIGDTDNTWLAIDGQPVAYYYESTTKEDGNETITGRVPVMLNGTRANLILIFDNDNPYGYIAGAVYDYVDGETDTVAKSIAELTEGDTIDYICDYYGYDGKYQNSYYLGEQVTYSKDMEISNVDVGANSKITYMFTDIYNQEYYSESISQ